MNIDEFHSRDSKPFGPGDKVCIRGLVSEAGRKLNGLIGVVKAYFETRSRWAVIIDGDTTEKLIKPENLMKFDIDEMPEIMCGLKLRSHSDLMAQDNNMAKFWKLGEKRRLLEDRYSKSRFRQQFNTAYSRWVKLPTNASRRKRFLYILIKLLLEFGEDGVQIAICVKWNEDVTDFSIFSFLLNHIRDTFFLGEVIIVISSVAFVSEEFRFGLIQYGVVQKVFDLVLSANHKNTKEVNIILYGRRLYKCMTCPKSHTKNRIKGMMPKYKKILDKFKIVEPFYEKFEKTELGRNYLAAEALGCAAIGVQKIHCSGCGIMEENLPFQKCSRCKLAFFCSKSCFKKNWKTHKVVCQSKV